MTQGNKQETTGREGGAGSGMKIGTIVVVLALLAGVVYLRGRNSQSIAPQSEAAMEMTAVPEPVVASLRFA